MAKRCLLVLTLLCLCAFSAFSLSSDETVQKASIKGNLTVGGGFVLSGMEARAKMSKDLGSGTTYYKGDSGFGVNAFLDYLLPVSIPVSLGVEVGINGSSFTELNSKDSITAIPFLFRAAYHFDLDPQLDLYIVGKLGYAGGSWTGDLKKALKNMEATVDGPSGFGIGIDLGAAWYFTEKVGIFAELGFDQYALSTDISYGDEEYMTISAPFNRFLTAGVSFKF
jgi:hypothetical protein